MRGPFTIFPALLASVASPALGQPEGAIETEDGRLVIDILVEQPTDPVLIERCKDEADVAKIAGEIVVCRERREQGPAMFDKQDWERRYAEQTQGPKTPNVDGSGIRLPTEGSLLAVTVTIPFGSVPEQPLFIDIEALPEAPEGSDADRIAKGLAPLEGAAR